MPSWISSRYIAHDVTLSRGTRNVQTKSGFRDIVLAMLKFALFTALVSACADDMKPLTAELVDCNSQVVGIREKCSPACKDYPTPGAAGTMCSVARFANDPVTTTCIIPTSQWLTGEDGTERMGCCVTDTAQLEIPVGEVRFYECDRSEWPER